MSSSGQQIAIGSHRIGRGRSSSDPGPFDLFDSTATFIRSRRVVRQPEYVELTVSAEELELLCSKGIKEVPLLIDTRSAQAFDLGISGNYFCGVVQVSTSRIYLCPLVPNLGGPAYPDHVKAFSKEGVPADPIEHSNVQTRAQGSGMASHVQLSERLGIEKSDALGFTVEKTSCGSGRIHSFTSRSLNASAIAKKAEDTSWAKNDSQRLFLQAFAQRSRQGGLNEQGQISEDWAIRIAATIKTFFRPGRPRSVSSPN